MSTVTIGCKLPHGLVLRLFKMEKVREPVMGGGSREVAQAREFGAPVTIMGWAHPQNAAPVATLASGAALTMNVDKEFWDQWLAQNKDHAAVKNGLIFAHEKAENTVAEANDKVKVKSGLERLDPAKLPRGIQKAEKAAA